jgi:regulator of sigma D
MEKRTKLPLATKERANKELRYIIQLWRTQRKVLNASLEESLYSNLSQDSPDQHLEHLCEDLMDYVSAGHFEIYQKLLKPCKTLNEDNIALVKNIYHNIEHSTDQALNFNDKYDNTDKVSFEEGDALPNDLHKLSKSLAIRFVLEEQLVEILN